MRSDDLTRILLRLCVACGCILIALIASGVLAITRVHTMGAASDTIVDQIIPISTAARDIDRQMDLQHLVQDDAMAFQDLQLAARYRDAHAQLRADFRIIATLDVDYPAIRTLMEQHVQPIVAVLDAGVQVAVVWSEEEIARAADAPGRNLRLRVCPAPPDAGGPPPEPGPGGAPPRRCLVPPRAVHLGLAPRSANLARYSDAMEALFAAVAKMQAITQQTSHDAQSAALVTIAVTLSARIALVAVLGFLLGRAIILANAQLMTLATRDPLTGQYNHRALVETLDRTLAQAHRCGTSCAILFLDIDHFKTINDTYGHLVGDAALKAFAGYVTAHMRGADILGRWGGEEFMILLLETDGAAALAAAERIRAAVAAYAFDAGYGAHMTCSIGVASYPDDGDSRDTLVAAADRALYTAKRLGRNQARRAGGITETRKSTEDAELRPQLVR